MFNFRNVRSPSDGFPEAAAPDGSFRVGGRVEWIDGNELILADALGNLKIRIAEQARDSLNVGNLVVVRVAQCSGPWTLESVEQCEEFPPPSGHSEWSSFVRAGKGKRLVARARVRRALREWFETQGFLELETPTWLAAPGLDSDVEPIAAEPGWLVTSPELAMKRALVGGVPRQFQFAKCFRDGELGRYHEPEFTMLEWYRAFSDLEHVIQDTEQLVVLAAATVGKSQSIDWGGRQIQLERPFMRLSIAEAFRRYADVHDVEKLVLRDRCKYFQLFVDQIEPRLAETDRPVFLHSYPAAEAALARVNPSDPRWAERAELYIAGVELCNGYSELTSATEQRTRFQQEVARRRQESQPVYPLDERFLLALEQGMPASAGNALGFDRLMMLILDVPAVADVVAFPRADV